MYTKPFTFKFTILFFTGLIIVSCGQRPTTPPPSIIGNGPIATAPITQMSTQNNISPSVVNVFVENSGSMDGYVKGVTEFEQAVYSYISDININSDVCNEMKLFYINSTKLEWRASVKDFIEKLEPNEFRLRGGNRQTTDLSNVIGDVIGDQKENEINILISDCVFSPGRNINANEYLVNQQIGIKGHLAKKLKEYPNFAVIIYQLQSKFEGRYYNCFDVPTNINAQRPFYIIIFGDNNRLQMLTKEVPISRIKGSGIKNSYCISNCTEQPEYSILVTPKIGSFNPDRMDPKHTITKVKINRQNPITPFSLSVGVDFTGLLLDNEYLCDESNYTWNNKSYDLEVNNNTVSSASYSHIMKLSLNSNIISKGRIDITLNKKSPTWAEDMTDEDGQNINAEGAMDKTFGLKYMINGIYDAYSIDTKYSTFTINIK